MQGGEVSERAGAADQAAAGRPDEPEAVAAGSAESVDAACA